ncbi:MAG: cell division protein ZapE [Thermomonas sp.]
MTEPELPSQRYAAGVARGDWVHDPVQERVLAELDRIHAAVTAPPMPRSLLQRMFASLPVETIPGLYLWGGVGRGKTFLIDLFHEGLPLPSVAATGRTDVPRLRSGRGGDRSQRERGGEGGGKRRTHFHRFMREVHAGLREHAGERDPLAAIARQWRASLQVLVLDEFFVSDIGDAMLLARLLEHLFAEGVVLVTSSNAAPSHLYKDGLQRVRFLPAIALIERNCHVVHLDSDEDYRLRALTRSPVYRAPLDLQSDAWLQTRWRALGADDAHRDAGIDIDGRRIPVRARGKGMCWFDFSALCEGPRGSADYIEIACEFHTVLIGGITRMDGDRDDAARRFVHLVDELYDRHVNLVCTADAEPTALYAGQRLIGAFERTASRLIEMRSAEYLAKEHRS